MAIERTKIEGLSEVMKALENAPKRVTGKVLRTVHRKGLAKLRTELRQATPVKTGNLRKNIKITNDKYNASGLLIGVSSDAFYARFIEYGTVIRETRRTGTVRGAVQAKPFIKPIFERNYNYLIEFYSRSYTPIIEQALMKESKRITKRLDDTKRLTAMRMAIDNM